MAEDVTLEKRGKLDAFLEKLEQVVVKKVEVAEVVLVFNYVLDHQVKSSNLIGFQCNLNTTYKSNLAVNVLAHLVEDWILGVYDMVVIVHQGF